MEELYYLIKETSGVSTDTRKITKDCLYVSLKGANFNGNSFALKAIELGAKYAIVDEQEYANHPSILFVENALEFLQKIANYHRKQFQIPVIGITGSNGKTTSKELINAVLSSHYNVLATEGNLNNHIGVPLTLLRLKKEHEMAIIEMGANKFKDIEELCSIAAPNYGIITNIGKAHLQGFGSFEGVLKTKKELYEAIELTNGTIVFNQDDQVLKNNLPNAIQSIGFSEAQNTIVNGKIIETNPFLAIEIKINGESSPILNTHLVGKYNFYNFLAAATFGHLFKVPFHKICKAIENYIPTNNRSQVQKTNNNTLIVDCYNANPSSMKLAIDSFSEMKAENKIAILGDMFELGEDSSIEHQRIIEQLNELKLDYFLVGQLFCQQTSKHCFEDKEALIQYLKSNPLHHQLILLKGSRGIGLEALIEYL